MSDLTSQWTNPHLSLDERLGLHNVISEAREQSQGRISHRRPQEARDDLKAMLNRLSATVATTEVIKADTDALAVGVRALATSDAYRVCLPPLLDSLPVSNALMVAVVSSVDDCEVRANGLCAIALQLIEAERPAPAALAAREALDILPTHALGHRLATACTTSTGAALSQIVAHVRAEPATA